MAATVDITLVAVNGKLAHSVQMDQDTITSSGSSQQSDFSVPSGAVGDLAWVITVAGASNIRALFGSNPTAVAAEAGGFLILAGQTREFAARAGDKVAVITAEV